MIQLRRILILWIFLVGGAAGCADRRPVSTPSPSPLPSPTPTLTVTATSRPAPTPTYAAADFPTPPPTPTRPAPASYTGPLAEGVQTRFGKGTFTDVQVSPDRAYLAAASTDGIYLYRPGTMEEVGLLPDAGTVMAWSSDGKRLAAADRLGEAISIWEVASRKTVRQIAAGPMMFLAWSPDGSRMGVGTTDDSLEVWDVDRGTLIYTAFGHTSPPNEYSYFKGVTGLAWSKTGIIATVGMDNKVILWDAEKGLPRFTLEKQSGPLAWSPDGTVLATRADVNRINLWDAETGEPVSRIESYCILGSMAWSPEGTSLAVGCSYMSSVEVFSVQTGQQVYKFYPRTLWVESLAWLDEATLVTIGRSKDVSLLTVWDVRSGAPGFNLRGTESGPSYVAWSPDGKTVAGAHGGAIILWDAVSGQARVTLDVIQDFEAPSPNYLNFKGLAFNPTGSLIAASWGDDWDVIGVWNTQTGEKIREEYVPRVYNLRWVSKGTLMANLPEYGDEGRTCLWNVFEPDEKRECRPRVAGSGSPNGNRIAAFIDGNLKIIDFGSWVALVDIPVEANVVELVWSPDGEKLAGLTREAQVIVWEAASGKEITQLGDMANRRGTEAVVKWSRDGTKIGLLWNLFLSWNPYSNPYSQESDLYLTVWSLTTGQAWEVVKDSRLKNTDIVIKAADFDFSPEGDLLVLGNQVIVLDK